jgi:riboflavin synthase
MSMFKIKVVDHIIEVWVFDIEAATEEEAREIADTRVDQAVGHGSPEYVESGERIIDVLEVSELPS